MAKEIAIYLGQDENTASLQTNGTLVIYHRQEGKWSIAREKSFSLQDNRTMRDWRQKVKEMVDFMAECKTFVALDVTGIPYFELEKQQCSVWEFEGNPESFRDYILEKEEQEMENDQFLTNQCDIKPIEVFPGCYRISLKEIQEKNMGVTSKQVLIPLLNQGNFYSLEILCNHIPPWLEMQILSGGLAAQAEKINGHTMKVTVFKKNCSAM